MHPETESRTAPVESSASDPSTIARIVGSRFHLDALDRDPSSIVAIAPDGCIGWANRGWYRFACENGGADAAIRPGDNYFAAIGGPLRASFEEDVARCLSDDKPLDYDYECSSSAERRVFRLRMLPLSGRAVLITHSFSAALPHDAPAEPPDEAAFRDDDGLIAQCSYCRRVRSPADCSWHWIPGWVDAMPARVTHVICATCRDFYWPTEPRTPRPGDGSDPCTS